MDSINTKKFNSSRMGDIAEFYAVTWLWDNGYEVFKNAGCSGPVDIVAIKDGETLLIDVKTGRQHSNPEKGMQYWKTKSRSDLQVEMGVVILIFNPDTRELRFTNHEDIDIGHRDQPKA